MTTINVKYIGTKDRKEDNITGSGLAWRGHGDVLPVTPAQWAQLSKHPDIWVRAEDEPPAPSAKPAGGSPIKLTNSGEGGTGAPGGDGAAGKAPSDKAKTEQSTPARKTPARKAATEQDGAGAPGGDGAGSGADQTGAGAGGEGQDSSKDQA